MKVDVAVIGAGLTGISTAYQLAQKGRKVVLLEKDTVGGVDSSHTTAHLTYVTDEQLSSLAQDFGNDHARAAWDAGAAAIGQIYENIEREGIECEFRWIPVWLHAPLEDKKDVLDSLKEDARLANNFGFRAEFESIAPVVNVPGVKFHQNALFHPRKYMRGLLSALSKQGVPIFEHSEVEEIKGQPIVITAGGYRVECDHVVVATHNPLMGKMGLVSATLLQTKLALYNTYAMGGPLAEGSAPEGSWYSTDDPYYYLRIHKQDGRLYAILGGEDHKTGQSSEEESFRNLKEKFHQLLPQVQIDHRWSGQVIETHDGLPYIGQIAEGQFIGTGYGGNGMTFGTISSVMARDQITGRKNPWEKLFDPHRKKLSGAWDYVMENIDYPYYLLRDRLVRGKTSDTNEIGLGEGKIINENGQKVAAYKNDQGKVVKCSAVCTHMGCIVHWNNAEKTWDCPCHGSRFLPEGAVMSGPAEEPLKRVG
ncbi:MAG: FAD-dependent oxidoreductase [Verrucomicrobiales bacterium]